MWSWPHWPRLNKPVSNTELWLGQSGSLSLLGIWNQNTLHTSDWSCVEPRLTQLSCYVWSCFLQTLHGLREKERMTLIFAFQFLAWVHFKICLPTLPASAPWNTTMSGFLFVRTKIVRLWVAKNHTIQCQVGRRGYLSFTTILTLILIIPSS